MVDEKIYTPEVLADTPLPNQDMVVSTDATDSTTQSGQVSTPSTIQQQDIPIPRTAIDLIGTALNTKNKKILKEFSFAPSGALQIGDYTQGQSGDIRISPDGIVARNNLGDVTFALDGDTGDAVFAGTIQAGTFVAGEMIVGDNRVIIDGANARIVISDNTGIDRILIGFLKNGF